jgi:uncharacterized protein
VKALPLSLRERRVFFDSAAYLALLDARDEHHSTAVDLLTRLADARYRPFTTNAVAFEAYSLILSAIGRDVALRFLDRLEAGQTVVVRVRARDEDRAKQILRLYLDKDFSFVDALSFAVMERLGITRAFTFDRHFAQYGLVVLTPDLV